MVYGERNHNQEAAIANLNSNSPLNFPESLSAEDLARDLDLFTNTQFFDFDFGTGPSTTFTSSLEPEQKTGDDVDNVQLTSNDPESMHHFNFLSGNQTSLRVGKVNGLDSLSFDLNSFGGATDEDPVVKRRKVDASSSEQMEPDTPSNMDDGARAAAEEDKRRRNTLASARFRAKKKMREQALEKDHKEMAAKIEKMENRIKELELENKWLRGLVVQNKP
jgi:septin family protein